MTGGSGACCRKRGCWYVHAAFGTGTCLFLLSLLLPFSPSFAQPLSEAIPGSTYFGRTVHSIEFSADHPVDRSHYDPYLGIKPGDVLTRSSVKEAIQSLYDSRRFSSIVAETYPEGDGVRLQFVLRHNYYFNTFSLEGEFDLKGRALWEWVSLPVGERFTWEKLEQARADVAKFMEKNGRYLAKVESRVEWEDSNHQANVIFDVEPGELAVIRSIDISVDNEEDVPEKTAQKLLGKFGFKVGKKFDRTRLADRMEELKQSLLDEGYLAIVPEVYEDFDPKTNSVALNLSVFNYKTLRVVVKGYKIERIQLQRLLSVLTEQGSREELKLRGARKLEEYLINRGYLQAAVEVQEQKEDPEGRTVLTYVVNRGRRSEIDYVRFHECAAFSEEEILESIGIRTSSVLQSSPFSMEILDEGKDALASLYRARGYLGAEISYEYDEIGKTNRFAVTYKCAEGVRSKVRSVTFEGNRAFDSENLLSRIGLKPEGAYSPSAAERDRQIIQAAYSDAGYLQSRATVQALAEDTDDAYSVQFQIEEGTQFLVDRVLILGNDHTRDSVVEKRIRLKTGDPLSLGRLLETQQALYRIGVFNQVRVAQQNPESRNPYRNVVVRLRESERFTMRYGIGYQEREKLRGILEFSDLNVLGLARRADLRLRGSSKAQEAVFNLRQTQFHHLPIDTYLSFSASYRQEEFGDVRRLGASYQFSRPINNHSWAMLRYNFKNVFVIYDKSIVDPTDGTSGDNPQREDTPVNLSTFSVAYINDSRDNYLDPTVGFFSSSEFGVTTKLLGEKDYVSFFTQNSYFRKLPKSFQSATSLRIGLIHPYAGSDVPISERFFAGGASSLRGFDIDFAGPLGVKRLSESESEFTPEGGNALFIASAELRRPVFSFLHLAGFYDTGNVFKTIQDFSFPGFSHTVGVGLRIKTPLGPLRLDYGYNLNLPSNLEHPDPPIKGLNRGHFFVTIGPPF